MKNVTDQSARDCPIAIDADTFRTLGHQLVDRRGGSDVRIEVRTLVARIATAEVALGILLGSLHRPGEEPTAERRERDEADPQLA